jgi:putative PIN family toxin of toxin-antitoxin system
VRRVTLDSNAFVSAIKFGGRPRALLELAIKGQVHISTSQAIIDETRRILEEKFGFAGDDMADAQTTINAATHRIKPTVILEVVKDDPDDNKIIECAVSSRSDAIITNDKDLLRMRVYDGIRMMRVGEFLRELEQGRGR